MEDRFFKRKANLVRAYHSVFGSEDGKIVLHDLMKSSNMLSSTFDADNGSLTTFKEGERNVVLRILKHLELDEGRLLEHFKQINEEAKNEYPFK